MLNLKKFLFMGGGAVELPADVQAALDAWRESGDPGLDEVHFHTRYVVLDIVCSGPNPETDRMLSIAASSVQQAMIRPEDSIFIDFTAVEAEDAASTETTAGPTVDRQLMAFLQFVGKDPLVTYHVPFVSGFLQRACKERLGVDFQPPWVDLAWLLPAMFSDKGDSIMPLDHWLDVFGLDTGNGRRSAMENTLLLARIFQMMLVRATGKDVDTAARLVDESRASITLRRTH